MTKFNFFTLLLIASIGSLSAQQVTSDTVTTGQGYLHQKFYSLSQGTLSTAEAHDWNFAFGTAVGNPGVPIRFNGLIGTIKLLPNAFPDEPITQMDTTGWAAEQPLYDNTEDIQYGALDQNNDPNDMYDYSWGHYNMVTHNVETQRIYGFLLNNEFYKIRFSLQSADQIYEATFAKLGASDSTVFEIDVTPYQNRNYIYTDIFTQTFLDYEPDKSAWDLLFGQYIIPIPYQGTTMYYPVAGAINNLGTEVAKVSTNASQADYSLSGQENFVSQNNAIGYDWKATGQGGVTIYDSLVYFVKAKDGAIWKLWFTNFISGSGTDALAGSFIFNKQLISGVGTKEINDELFTQLYPNPANDKVQLVVNAENATTVEIYSLTGAKVYSETISGGLQNHVISTASLKDGLYQVVVSNENGQRSIQKLMINH